jgi:signal transduction histidine kinase
VNGTLANIRTTRTATILEIQSDGRTFIARLADGGQFSNSLDPSSRLELAGTYNGLGGNRAAGRDITSFELLLNSAADIHVLAHPPWWTLKRLLIILGALACVLAAAVLWITQLHRQVEERTAELTAEIQERQRLEHQRAMEQERTRIAQDLHDELGSGITEMSMLAARAKTGPALDEKRALYLDQVGEKARDLVTGLDEIVWAMHPRHDSLSSVVSYFSLYAERFLGLANIGWSLEDSAGAPDLTIDSQRRHQLFLAFKEALTNVVRHSGATQVRIRIHAEGKKLQVRIADDGRGLPSAATHEDMDGVINMRHRIEQLGGSFKINGQAGTGTTVSFEVPAE